jgi:hypothetical protein
MRWVYERRYGYLAMLQHHKRLFSDCSFACRGRCSGGRRGYSHPYGEERREWRERKTCEP